MSVLKTYGVSGLIEWNTEIRAGKASMRIVFSGGALTAYGTTPATFATRNPLVQNIIERSDYYKEGRITLLSSVADTEPKPKVAEPRRMETPTPVNNSEGPEDGDNATEGASKGNQVVKVTCLDDAKEYLRENFGVRNIHTKADATKVAAEKGIVFEGL